MKNKNGKLKVCVPDDIAKIERTIKALKNVIKTDTNDFDKKMHKEALKAYQSKLKELNNTK
ncbi:unknown [Clostridium sp. CAG:221]|uniref:hypothetical protein n=1 Tax=Clostridium sp. CAG:221 TaxID=1262780 RepID=UPI00033DDC46|nr:hypothetical protein [Clostridium sp. CAG:221]CDB14697.1 unknown [Clostridium sp. CAG:221]